MFGTLAGADAPDQYYPVYTAIIATMNFNQYSIQLTRVLWNANIIIIIALHSARSCERGEWYANDKSQCPSHGSREHT